MGWVISPNPVMPWGHFLERCECDGLLEEPLFQALTFCWGAASREVGGGFRSGGRRRQVRVRAVECWALHVGGGCCLLQPWHPAEVVLLAFLRMHLEQCKNQAAN